MTGGRWLPLPIGALLTLIFPVVLSSPARPLLAEAAANVSCPSQQAVNRANLRPIIVIHGWNSSAGKMLSWANVLQKGLTVRGANVQTVRFDYSAARDAWPDNDMIRSCLAQYIIQASRAFTAGGGDGKVILIAHSMGGIAARFASVLSWDGVNVADRLAGIVTVSAPSLGSQWGNTLLSDAAAAGGGSLASAFNLLRRAVQSTGSNASVALRIVDELDRNDTLWFKTAAVCLAPPATRPSKCASPPQVPSKVPVYALGTNVAVNRAGIFGASTLYLNSDGIVSFDSATAYQQRTRQPDGKYLGGLGPQETCDVPESALTDLDFAADFTATLFHFGSSADTNAPRDPLELVHALTAAAAGFLSPCGHSAAPEFGPTLVDEIKQLMLMYHYAAPTTPGSGGGGTGGGGGSGGGGTGGGGGSGGGGTGGGGTHLSVYRTSGPAGFYSWATGFTCPAPTPGMTMFIVTDGAGQPSYGGWSGGTYPSGPQSINVGTSVTATPGIYTAHIACKQSLDNPPVTGTIVASYRFTQTVTSTARHLAVSPNPISPGDVVIVADGGGCGPYSAVAQSVTIELFDRIKGGNAVASAHASVDGLGRWGPAKLTVPISATTTQWAVTAYCYSTRNDSGDSSGYSYSQVVVPGS